MKPTIRLARCELKNEPCPQSWKMMNRRTWNPAASAAAGTTSHQEIEASQGMATHNATYGSSVLTSCQPARQPEERR
jgi:hypothetical protein